MAPIKKGDLSDPEQKLLDVILKGTAEEVRALLKEPDVGVDFLDQTGMTPLQHAAFKGRLDMCKVFLSHGADVNSNYHDNGYTALMFAALSGNKEVTRLMLQAGANTNHINSVNRNAAQMAAFVGQHQCVSVINNFFPKENLDYYIVPQGLEKEAKLPQHVAPSLLTLINSVNMHPVKISQYIADHSEIIAESYKVGKVLDILVEKSMKSRDTNDVLAVKMHYLATVVRLAAKSASEKNSDLDPWIKSLLKGRDGDGFPEKQDRLIRQSLKEFPYIESQLLEQIVRQLAPVKIGDTPTALSMLMQSINGQRSGFDEETDCATCGDSNPAKKCSACKMVGYCNQSCQKSHWFTHKKFCKKMAGEFVEMEKWRIKREEEEKRLEEEAQQRREEEAAKKKEEEEAKQEEDTYKQEDDTGKQEVDTGKQEVDTGKQEVDTDKQEVDTDKREENGKEADNGLVEKMKSAGIIDNLSGSGDSLSKSGAAPDTNKSESVVAES